MSPRIIAALAGVLVMSTTATADVKGPTPFGKTADGTPVESYTLTNKNGVSVKIMTLGATITEINVPDKNGKFSNVVLGFDSAEGYLSDKNQYFGATTGRVANRIAKGKFKLDGKEYKLATNNGPNHLHGGIKRSLDKVVWNAKERERLPGFYVPETLDFRYTSPAGEEGYPGELAIKVSFSLDDKNQLRIDYSAITDKATPVNLTNHSYFNLAGAGSATVLDQELTVAANEYVPVDETLIPTGKLAPVKATVLDFTTETRLGARIEKLYETGAKGYDHCYVLTKREKTPTFGAKVRDPQSGRILTVSTDQPGVQVYTGNFLFGQKGKDGKEYKQRSALCLETGGLPDAVNQPTFPSIILRPGETYRHNCVYAFSVE
jgi:aldose 1-epimerase